MDWNAEPIFTTRYDYFLDHSFGLVDGGWKVQTRITMTETTEERRKRLQAMKAAVKDNVNSENQPGQEGEEHASKKIKLRNYTPKDASIGAKEEKENEKEGEKGGDAAVVSSSIPANGDFIKSELAQLQMEEINIVPKHPNFDLKQGIQQRLDKLKRRTQRSIVEMLRAKIASTSE